MQQCRKQQQQQPFYGPFCVTTWMSQCQKRTSGLYGVKGRLTEADTPTIRLGATPSGLTSAVNYGELCSEREEHLRGQFFGCCGVGDFAASSHKKQGKSQQRIS